VQLGEEVEVEARDAHKGVVGVLLGLDGDFSEAVLDEVEVVVA
jgi:hypothetical protein